MIVVCAVLKLTDKGWSESFLRRSLPYIYPGAMIISTTPIQNALFRTWKIRIPHFYPILNNWIKTEYSIFLLSKLYSFKRIKSILYVCFATPFNHDVVTILLSNKWLREFCFANGLKILYIYYIIMLCNAFDEFRIDGKLIIKIEYF